MLKNIQIKNFTIVESLDIDLSAGMTVITGETGAGKSIMLDALNLALGERATNDFIRHGQDRAEVTVSIESPNGSNMQDWLQQQELDDSENECIIRRIVTQEGRSKGFINGRTVPMQTLRELGDLLIDIHGQHAHQSLLKKHLQLLVIDDFGQHGDLLTQLRSSYKKFRSLSKQLEKLLQNQNDRQARTELLLYQTQELEELDLSENELKELEDEHTRLAHQNQIQESCHNALFTLDENEQGAITSVLSKTQSEVEDLRQFDQKLASISGMLNEAQVQIQETISELRSYLDNMSIDPQRLQWLDDRLSTIYQFARKHRVEPKQLYSHYELLKSELESLQNASEAWEQLEQDIEAEKKVYHSTAKKLSAMRLKTANKLAKDIEKNIKLLGMEKGRFKISVTSEDTISASGHDNVEFLVSTNPGEPLKPLTKVASGGELSRISLAIQVITASTGRIPVLVFDEVDVGIGGGTAETVGRLLRKLSVNRQVMCITHQPQVAALGHQHLHVHKQSTNASTESHIELLNEQQRTKEIARMLGGLKITSQTLSHAEDMINRSQSACETA